ncbi:MAG TPA: hypothetical protein VFV73_11300 [Streptosporangiaceae bacterium]|nr:hypothetical protein [Streptosporangiaceae bacterium]
MNDEYPEQGIEGQGQDLDDERGGVPALPSGETTRPPDGLPPTGDDRVDAALAGLGRLPGAPVDDHVAVLEEVHGRLRDILGELSEGMP